MSHPIDRRTFLRHAGAVAVGAAAVGVAAGVGVPAVMRRFDRPWDEAAFAPPGTPRVLVAPVASYDVDLEAEVEEGLRSVGADVGGRSVLLKPNLVEFDRGSVINTDPRLVAAAVLAVRRLGASSVVVAEGPGHRRDTRYLVEASGLGEALEGVDAPFVDLNLAPVSRVPLRSRFTPLRDLWLPAPVTDADVVISMPKMKTHHWVGVTLSLKNLFGVLPGTAYGWPKNLLHWRGIPGSILDVNRTVGADLAIVDGVIGMEGDGPVGGDPVRSGAVVVGTALAAVDATCCRLMGLRPELVPYLVAAARHHGSIRAADVAVSGTPIAHLARTYRVLPHFAHLL